ncbi:MAG: GntR family transcriptional regulator [Treponemataceae bacterium]
MKAEYGTTDFFVTSAEKTYQAILQKIITGDFAPGKRLVRRSLAEALGVSSIPVLEALKRLEQDGLVEYRARWGCIVAIPTIEKVKDMFVMREAIECQVSRVLAISATETQKKTLRELAVELDRVRYESADALLVTDFHYRLHMTMAEYAGFASLSAALRRLNFFWLLCKAVQHRRKKSELQRNWHTTLIETILNEGPEAADRAMREHIRDSYVPFVEDLGVAVLAT